MTGLVIDIGGGQIVEFPDEAAAQQYFASQGGAQPAPPPQRGFGAMLYDNVIGNPDDGVNSPGERLGTWLNRAGETMTLGTVGDEAAAAVTGMLPGRTYEGELERYRGNEEAMSGMGRLSADLAGGLTGAVAAPVGTLARGASMGSRLAASGLSGAGMGATYGFMEGEGGLDERLGEGGQGAGFGLAAGLAAPVIGGLVQRGADAIVGNRAIRQAAAGAPSTDELRAMGQAAYRQIDDAGVQIRPESFSGLVGQMDDRLTNEGLDRLPGPGSLTPRSARVMEIARQMDDQMRNANVPAAAGQSALPGPGTNVPGSIGLPFRSLDQLRRHAGNAAAQVSPDARTDARLGAIGIEQIDDFVRNLGPDDVASGDIETLQRVIPQARDLWARMSRSGMVDDAIEASEGYLSGPASGIRNQFRRIVNSPRLSRGFSDAELSVMRRVAQGSIPERILHNLGSGMGQVGATIAGGALGYGGLGPVGSLTGAMAGAGLTGGISNASGALAGRNAELARAVIANGRLPAQLPVASDANRRIVEELMRRGTATAAAR